MIYLPRSHRPHPYLSLDDLVVGGADGALLLVAYLVSLRVGVLEFASQLNVLLVRIVGVDLRGIGAFASTV